jgi:hypothetical protein
MAAVKTDVVTVTAWDGTPTVSANSFRKIGVPLAGLSVIEAADVQEVVQLVAGTPCAFKSPPVPYSPVIGEGFSLISSAEERLGSSWQSSGAVVRCFADVASPAPSSARPLD